MTVATRSREYHRAVVLVGRWAEWYTRDLDPRLAGERRDELSSDLWEQGAAADEAGTSGPRVGRSVIGRMLRGMPADLAWRHVRRGYGDALRLSAFQRWERSGLLVAAALLGIALTSAATALSIRLASAVLRGQQLPDPGTIVTVPLVLLVLLCGLILLALRRTRFLGALWLGAGGAGLLLCIDPALSWTSVTYQELLRSPYVLAGNGAFSGGAGRPDIQVLLLVMAVGVAVFYLALAVNWMPTRRGRAATARPHPMRKKQASGGDR